MLRPFWGTCILGLLCLHGLPAVAQYYFKGLVTNPQQHPIAFVKFNLQQKEGIVESGGRGEYGFASRLASDSATIFAEGYDTLTFVLSADSFQHIMLQPNAAAKALAEKLRKRNSLMPAAISNDSKQQAATGETYNKLVHNPFVTTAQFPHTGFGPNTHRASYTNIRRMLTQKIAVPVDAVRVEEMINYFDLQIASPPHPNEDISIGTAISDCPWNETNKLVFVNLVAKQLPPADAPPANFVLLLDNSGSMESAERLPMLKAGMRKMIESLRPDDRIAIVTYGGAAGIRLPPTYGTQKDTILSVLDNLQAGGSTPGSNGIRLAYELATTNAVDSANNRVLLITDGDFNVGAITEKELEDLIKSYSHTGVYLSCFGVGMGNYKDSKIEILSRYGKGNFSYLDTESETEKALVYELTQNAITIADDVLVHMDINPKIINSYRLLGYDNNSLALKDSSNTLLDGQLGAGSSVMILLEVQMDNAAQGALSPGSLTTYYTSAGTNRLDTLHYQLPNNYMGLSDAPLSLKLAACTAWLADLLRKSAYTSGQFETLNAYANQLLQSNSPGETELKMMTLLARDVYEPQQEKPNKRAKKGKKKNRQ